MGGRRRTSRSAVARKACARDAVGRAGAAAAQTRACRFFSSTSTLGCGAQGAAGRKGGPISSASGYFSSLCWSWGRRTRRRRRGAARARRGERHRPCGAARRAVRRGVKRIAQRGLRFAQRGDRSRRRGRQPSASGRFGRGESHAHPFERGHKGQGEHEATADVEQQRHHAEEGEALHVIVRAPGRKSSSSLSSGAKNCSTPGVHSPVSVREPAATPGVVLTASMQSPVTKPTTTYNHRGVPWRRMRSTKT